MDYNISSSILVHETGITCAHAVGNVMATGSYDRSVRLTELTTGTTLLTLRGHKKAVRCVKVSNNLIISGSNDNTIRVWNGRTGACIKEFVGHKAPVTALQMLDDNYLMSSSQDSTIKIWDMDHGECFDTFRENGNLPHHNHFTISSTLLFHHHLAILTSQVAISN
jgi:WD40 repeat protein